MGLSQQESVARDAAERGSDAWFKAGFPVHPVTCSPGGETLGWEFDPLRPVVGVSRRGLWRLRIALLHVASSVWAREHLATCSAAHALSQRGGVQRRRLWVQVSRELRLAASLIFLAPRHLSAPWCSEVSLFDASRSSCGCERNGPLQRSPRSVAEKHISDHLDEPHITFRRHSHRHRSLCHPCLTCRSGSGEHS